MAIPMTEATGGAALQRLMTWLSPAFPVGAFAYSAGLETAIKTGVVANAAATADWLRGQLRHGNAAIDAALLAEAHRAGGDPQRLAELAGLCLALCPSRQRIAEIAAVGDAFIAAARAWPHPILQALPAPCPYPIAVGAVAGAHGLDLDDTLTAFLLAFCQSQISVAIRLVPLGQTAGLTVLAGLEPDIATAVSMAKSRAPDDLGTISYAADVAAMAHETLESRIFRS